MPGLTVGCIMLKVHNLIGESMLFYDFSRVLDVKGSVNLRMQTYKIDRTTTLKCVNIYKVGIVLCLFFHQTKQSLHWVQYDPQGNALRPA